MKKVLKVIVNTLAWILLALALLVTVAVFSSERNNGIAKLFGYMPMSVQSDSMAPTFREGDMVIVKEIDDLYDLKEDDVITFYTLIEGKRVLNTHRIVAVNKTDTSVSFTTKGDNNSINDKVDVAVGDIVGKWTGVKLKGIGKVANFLKTSKGFFICIVIPMAIFFLIELYKFIVTLIAFKKPKMSQDEEEEIKRRAVEEYLAGLKEKEGQGAPAGTNEKEDAQEKR
jgi:signal peptidase